MHESFEWWRQPMFWSAWNVPIALAVVPLVAWWRRKVFDDHRR